MSVNGATEDGVVYDTVDTFGLRGSMSMKRRAKLMLKSEAFL